MIPPRLQRKPRVRARPAKRRAAPDPVLAARLTSCVFPRPVALTTAHPGSEVRLGPREPRLEKPQQLCASWRLEAAVPRVAHEEHFSRQGFTLAFLKTVSRSGDASWDRPAARTSRLRPARPPLWKDMVPEAFYLAYPFSNHQVTSADIQRQEEEVRRARERLAEALGGHSLAGGAAGRSAREAGAGAGTEAGAGAAGGPGM